MYSADLPSNRPNFSGTLGRVESLMRSNGVTASEVVASSVELVYSGITMPVFIHPRRPSIVRPVVGTKTDTAELFISADLVFGIDPIERKDVDMKLLRIGLRNFRKQHGTEPVKREVLVGRPILYENDLGMSADEYEGYKRLTMVATFAGKKTLKAAMMALDQSGYEQELLMRRVERKPEKRAEFLFQRACLFAAGKTSRTPVVRVGAEV